MQDELVSFIESIRANPRLNKFDEAATKQTVVLRLLDLLGWDIYERDEVYPEYPVDSQAVDYSLIHDSRNRVFIEAKRVSEPPEKHEAQLLEYSFKEGVGLACLTNGITWSFYLPLRKGHWSERKFYTVDLVDQESKEIAQRFMDFLSKKNVASGKYLKNANQTFDSRRKDQEIIAAMPKAWSKLVSEPDQELVGLLAEKTEGFCGHRPESEAVAEFLASIPPPSRGQIPVPPVTTQDRADSHTGKSITSFSLKGREYKVNSWKGMLIKICDLMLSKHKDQFDRVLGLAGRKRPYFSGEPGKLRHPYRVASTDIYVEVNLGANSIVKLSRSIVGQFGYEENDLLINAK